MSTMTMRIFVFSLAALLTTNTAASSSPWNRQGVVVAPPSFVTSIRGGASSPYDSAKNTVLEKASRKIEDARRKIIDEGSIIPDFGAKADDICSTALEEFASSAPAPEDTSAGSVYAQKLEELESALDAPLQVLYLRQLALIRERALSSYRSASRASEASDYEAMLLADSEFVKGAEASARQSAGWTSESERAHLRSVMNEFAQTSKKLADMQIQSSKAQSTAMQFLQHQQQMIQNLQMQLYGQSSPWNVGMAYRIPDTNFNLQGSYQQGRANLQVSCVPDEYAPMLGPNGFTNGVGPGNLGLSLNLSM